MCHGIWSHLTKEEVDFGKEPDFPVHHAVQVGYRKGHFKRGGRLVAVSQFIQYQMEIQWGFESEVINNAIDLEKYVPREIRDLPDKKLIIHGINDRSNPVKGWDHIEYLKKHIDADIWSLDEAHTFFQRNSVAEIDKYKILAMADLVVIPSAFEGFGYFALEALACNVPVVAYSVGLFREICSRNLIKKVGLVLDRNERSSEFTCHAVRSMLRCLSEGYECNPREVAEDYLIQKFHEQWSAYLSREFGWASPPKS